MAVRLIVVPYDSGHRNRRMGRGPQFLLDGGASARLEREHGPLRECPIEHREAYPMELAVTFGLHRSVAVQVAQALEEGEFPLLLSGNCHCTVGALGGYGGREVGLVWFDAHGDVNTPETTTSGLIDGMPVAMATGRCWRRLTDTIPGFRPLPDDRVLLCGVREFDGPERELFDTTGMRLISCEELEGNGPAAALGSAFDSRAGRLAGVHLHVDLDVLDPGRARANTFQPAGGLSPELLLDAVRALAARQRLLGASVSAYDPAADPGGTGLEAGLGLIELIGAVAARQARERPSD